MKRIPISLSIVFLIAANVIPLFGVLFFNWNLFHIVFLYWIESAVVGLYNIFKLMKIGGLISMVLIPFFIVHYGGFMAGHLIFILALFAPELASFSFFPSQETMVMLFVPVALPLAVLLVSHGVSFFSNFIGNREYEYTNARKQMHAPYRRIILMHSIILFGGWLIMLFGEPVVGLVLLIVFKIITDIRGHAKEHSLGIKAAA